MRNQPDLANCSDFCWIGYSPALRKVEDLCARFSGVAFPVLILGERGTGKLPAAYAIHRLSHRKHQRFVECCCLQLNENNIQEQLKQHYAQAKGGTLFIRNIHVLPTDVRDKIRHFWEREYMGQSPPVRIIASVAMEHDGSLTTSGCAPWLMLYLPTLQERHQDISALVQIFLQKYATIHPLELDDDSWQLIREHKWQDNVKGLERAIAVLSVMAEQAKVDKASLLHILPELNISANPTQPLVPPESSGQDEIAPGSPYKTLSEQKLVLLILDKHLTDLPWQHAAIVKSLHYLAEQYQQKITLEQVAKTAFVSPPHLSYLYRKHLGTSFRQLLLKVRIEKAKQLLRAELPMQVTQISVEIGFHDLSHFEKTFRKIVGINPLQYRHQR